MEFTGIGNMVDLVEEWNDAFTASENTTVLQEESMSGRASMRIAHGQWTIEMGE